MTLKCDKNFVRSGDLLQVSGSVTDSRGSQINSGRIMLERKRFMLSSIGKARDDSFQKH